MLVDVLQINSGILQTINLDNDIVVKYNRTLSKTLHNIMYFPKKFQKMMNILQ